MSKKCYHRYPYEDENPEFYECVGGEYFDGTCTYRCIHCGYLYVVDSFTEAGEIFEAKFDELRKKRGAK